ncbi:MAG: hypothetical protein V3R81_14100 [Gammaproteobacteria bacterium]
MRGRIVKWEVETGFEDRYSHATGHYTVPSTEGFATDGVRSFTGNVANCHQAIRSMDYGIEYLDALAANNCEAIQ